MSKISISIDEPLKKLHLSRNKLAVEAKIRPGVLQEMSDGKTKAVKLDTLMKILDALNILAIKNQSEFRFNVNDLIDYEFKLRMIGEIAIDLLDDDEEIEFYNKD